MIPKHAAYSLLLVLPSLLTAGFAMTLLYKEEDRLRQASLTNTRERAGRVAETIDLAVAEVKNGLMDSLGQLPAENLSQELTLWQTGSSLVCNAFTCSPDGTVSPQSVKVGDLDFLKPDGIFDWDRPAGDSPRMAENPSTQDPALPSKLALQDLKQKSVWDAKLAGIQKGEPQFAWIYKPSVEGLRIAAWYRPAADADVRVVEISVDSLLQELKAGFPSRPYATEVLMLANHAGEVLHSSDPAFHAAGDPDFIMPIGRELPGWEVRAYHRWQNSSASRLFLFGSSVLILLAAVAIAGGMLLLLQSRRTAHLAAQKTTFVSNVSHELKTPLTSIRMYAEMLEAGRVKEPARIAKYLGVIVAESQRLTRLVNNVLDFSRLEQGRKDYKLVEQDVIPVLESALESQRIALEKAGIRVRREFDPERPVRAFIDADVLEAVLVNLIDNAIKYAAAGKELRFQVEEGTAVQVRVIDAGPGVPGSQRECIFDRFHRVEDALTDQSGTGLGLSIARKLARGMGGDLRYVDARGSGACFEVTLRPGKS